MTGTTGNTPPGRVGRHGQPRIDITAAIARQRETLKTSPDLTFGEVCRAYLAAHYDGADMQLRKWVDALGNQSAWTITAQDLALAGQGMIEAGYSPSTVNRNFSQLD